MSPEVVVDALSARFGGGLSYLLRQLPALETVAPDLDLTVLASPATASALRGALRSTVRTIDASPRAMRFAWEQIVLPARHRSSAVYCPGNFVPLVSAPRCVLVLQNPNYFGVGRLQPHNQRTARKTQIALCVASVRRAGRVLAISESLRADVRRDVPAAAQRIGVLLSGAPQWTAPSRRPAAAPPTGEPFLLSVANDAPHKRLDVLVQGWAIAHRARSTRSALVLAGHVSPARAEHLQSLADGAGDLVLLGPVADRAELRWLLEHAVAMVAAAILEAHPLTPAEAGALGCPLLLSDVAPHREVAGNHAAYFRVDDPDALATAIGALGSTRRDHHWMWPVTWEDNARQLAAALRGVATC